MLYPGNGGVRRVGQDFPTIVCFVTIGVRMTAEIQMVSGPPLMRV